MTAHEPAKVSIDGSFARFGPKSFALDKINGVEVRSEPARGEGAFFVAGVLALIGVMFFLTSPSLLEAIVVGMIGYVAYRAWQRSTKLRYHLVLKTSSSETHAFSSDSEEQVIQLRDAIAEAIADDDIDMATDR